MSITEYVLFIIAAITQISTPRPSTIFLVDNSLKYIPGRLIFINTGSLLAAAVLASFSLLGVGSLLLVDPEILMFLKYAGAIYLFFLGLNLILTVKNNQVSSTQQVICERISVLWGRSFMTEISKPKKVIFFSLLIPQFVENPQSLQTGNLFSTILLLIFVKFLLSSVYVLMAAKMERVLAEAFVIIWIKRASGTIIMLVGVTTGITAIK